MTDTDTILDALAIAASDHLDDALRARASGDNETVSTAMDNVRRLQRLMSRIETGELLVLPASGPEVPSMLRRQAG